MEKKEDTILHFIYTGDETEKINNFYKEVTLEYAEVKHNFNSTNDLKIDVELNENSIYYNEILNFNTKENIQISFEYPIYAHIINNVYIDNPKCENGERAKSVSLEIIFQTIKNELFPKSIYYDNKELIFFDIFKNKLRKRISLINIDPEKLNFINDIHKQYPDFHFISDSSYQILVRIPIEGDNEYTISNSEFKNNNNRLKHKNTDKPKVKIDKKQILYSMLCFKKEFFLLFITNLKISDNIEEIKSKIDNFDDKYKYFRLKEKYYYDNVLNYKDFEDIDINIFIQVFYYLDFLVIKGLKDNDKENVNFIGKLLSISDFNDNYIKLILKIKDLDINAKDKLLLIKASNAKFLDSFKCGDGIDNIEPLIIDKENKFNPYIKSLNFIKNIIFNLNEESRLFEIFLYLDNDVIQNLLVKNEESPDNLKIFME